PPAPPAPPAPSALPVPDIELVAPVEMWFGEVRIGVKEGTKTYEQFQRYAAVLFDELAKARKREAEG
ncbi:MAG: hypothetical protein KGZ40_09060, partial [Clostridiales bacterium]|nr:hypothetical protein [Clostridiales bacterium]